MRFSRNLSTIFLLCFLTATGAPGGGAKGQAAVPDAGSKRLLTLDDVEGPRAVDIYGWMPFVSRWLRDGKHYLVYATDPDTNTAQLMQVDAQTGTLSRFYDAARMEKTLAALPNVSANAARSLSHSYELDLSDNEQRILLPVAGDLYAYDLVQNKVFRLTNTPREPKTNTAFSPDGRHVAYVKGSNLYVADVSATGPSERAITRDGGPLIYNGRLDWVYEEEVYGRGKTDGYQWSPDSRHLAFLRIDEAPVKPFALLDQLPRLQNTEQEWYPKAGDPNPFVSLFIADTQAGQTAPPRRVDLSKYPASDRLLVRFGWTKTGDKLTYQVQNRIQTFLDLNTCDLATSKTTTLFRETTPAWVEIIEKPLFLSDGTFLWQSDRTGFRHVYHYKADGTLIGAVTKGDWDVRELLGVRARDNQVFFAATEHNPIGRDVYRVPLNGDGLTRITRDRDKQSTSGGTHETEFDPTFSFYTDRWSDLTTNWQMRLLDAQTGGEVRVLSDNPEPARTLGQFPRPGVERAVVQTRDGFPMDAVLIKPPAFDPAKKYPVYCEVYAGPGIATVHDSWGTVSMWHRLLAQKGYLVWLCDNRSASGKGVRSQWPIYKNVGPSELADIEDGVTYLKNLPFVDGARIGIGGWSFGGFMTEYALTHSKSFKIGVAGAGVSDWRLYDTIYTERYMQTPLLNPDGYKSTAPTQAAPACSGKLLILHGMMDDNVHLQNSIQMVYALQKAGKDFQMMFYPSTQARHGIRDGEQNRHLKALQTKFIEENL